MFSLFFRSPKLLTVFGQLAFFFLFFLSSVQAYAFTCATFSNGSTRVKGVVVNSSLPCVAPQSTVFSPTEFAQFQQMQLDVAALQAASSSSAAAGETVFDPVLAGSLWMFALSVILACWLLAKNAGIIIDMVKRW